MSRRKGGSTIDLGGNGGESAEFGDVPATSREEERRILYVAMSRAKSRLVMTYLAERREQSGLSPFVRPLVTKCAVILERFVDSINVGNGRSSGVNSGHGSKLIGKRFANGNSIVYASDDDVEDHCSGLAEYDADDPRFRAGDEMSINIQRGGHCAASVYDKTRTRLTLRGYGNRCPAPNGPRNLHSEESGTAQHSSQVTAVSSTGNKSFRAIAETESPLRSGEITFPEEHIGARHPGASSSQLTSRDHSSTGTQKRFVPPPHWSPSTPNNQPNSNAALQTFRYHSKKGSRYD